MKRSVSTIIHLQLFKPACNVWKICEDILMSSWNVFLVVHRNKEYRYAPQYWLKQRRLRKSVSHGISQLATIWWSSKQQKRISQRSILELGHLIKNNRRHLTYYSGHEHRNFQGGSIYIIKMYKGIFVEGMHRSILWVVLRRCSKCQPELSDKCAHKATLFAKLQERKLNVNSKSDMERAERRWEPKTGRDVNAWAGIWLWEKKFLCRDYLVDIHTRSHKLTVLKHFDNGDEKCAESG